MKTWRTTKAVGGVVEVTEVEAEAVRDWLRGVLEAMHRGETESPLVRGFLTGAMNESADVLAGAIALGRIIGNSANHAKCNDSEGL